MRKLRYLPAILLAALLPFIVHAASGYKVNETDLDSIFAPYHTGWPQAAATGFKVGGADINTRYAPLSTGSAAAATKYKTASGQDLNAIFAAIGTTGVQVATQPSAVSGSAAAGNPSGAVTSNTTSVLGTKGGGSYSYTWHIASGPVVSFTSGSSRTTGVTYSAVPAGTTYSGTMYCTISDGITSANTSSAGWSLTNTTPAEPIFTITAAQLFNSNNQASNYYGYATNFQPYYGGTLNSAAGFLNGTTVYEVFDNASTVLAIFGVSGLTADPGQASLGSVTVNGVTLTGASATTYTYYASSGHAQWQWTGSTFNLVAGTVYNGSIVRNSSAW